MTSDQQFLKSANIRPDDPVIENWMEWRTDEVTALRMSVATWINHTAEAEARGNRWRAIAVLAILFAAMLFFAPIIERWTR